MRLLTSLAVFLALRIPSNALSLPPSLSLTPDTPYALNLNVTNDSLFCDSRWGSKLNKASCKNAWENMGVSTQKKEYRLHTEGILSDDIRVPLRHLSDDGECAIDIDLPNGLTHATFDDFTLFQLAGAVVVKCVYNSGTGGIVYTTGKQI